MQGPQHGAFLFLFHLRFLSAYWSGGAEAEILMDRTHGEEPKLVLSVREVISPYVLLLQLSTLVNMDESGSSDNIIYL
jgi:hypothetical protein